MSTKLDPERMDLDNTYIYRSTNGTWGLVWTDKKTGHRCSSFVRKNQALAIFVRQNFRYNKSSKKPRIWLQEKLGPFGGLHTVGVIDLEKETYMLLREMTDTAEPLVNREYGFGLTIMSNRLRRKDEKSP